MPTTRDARPEDAADMAALINEIIATGGTTAHQQPFTPESLLPHYITHPEAVCCTLAVEEAGRLLGFQSVVRMADPAGGTAAWASIGSFARLGETGRGIGAAMFAHSLGACRAAGIAHIDATIRADNVPGLAYYSRIGFVDYDRIIAAPLSDGRRVDRIRKRFDL